MSDVLARLTEFGVSIWLDDLSRELLESGELERLVADRHVRGITSNPTIFASALAKGDTYTAQLADLGTAGHDADSAAFVITTDDVRRACDVLRPVFDATGGVDGRVSIEVEPALAHDCDATLEAARQLWAAVARPNAMIKIPATRDGLPAVSGALAEGISVNVTLIFSLDRYREVMDAFLTGLERAREAGRNLATISSVASFFVSRVDTEVDRRLDRLGTEQARTLRGRAAVANARLAFQAYEEMLASDRWQSLASAGARPQRPLWASTGVKDPAYPDTMYVTDLVVDGTVNTMPSTTLAALADHGELPGDAVHGRYDEAATVLADLEALGISYRDVTDVLEREGVEKFEKSWNELLATVSEELGKAVTGDREEAQQ